MADPRGRAAVLRGHLPAPGAAPAAGAAPSAAASPASAPQEYAVVLPERLDAQGPWTVRRSALSPHELVSRFPAPDDAVGTLYDNLEASIAKYPKVPYLGQRLRDGAGKLGPYDWMTYEAVGAQRRAIGAGLLAHGVRPGEAVGLYSVNCRDWALVDHACAAYSMPTVPLYDTLGEDAVKYICGHADLAAVACSADVLPTLLQALPAAPCVRLVVVYGLPPGRAPPAAPPGVGARVVALDAVRAAGAASPSPPQPPRPGDVATICYTSGTTGVPKGAVLTHASMVANAAGSFRVLTAAPGDRHISYLPLAHIYERITMVGVTHCGVSVGFYGGDVVQLLDDVLELRPTIFCSVPRLWNRIYDKVLSAVRSGGGLSRRLFDAAYASKRTALGAGDLRGGAMGAFWDRLVFSKVRARVGGCCRLMTSGASPISPEVIDFMRVAFGATVVEGYGMTETACIITLTAPWEATAGHVGGPVPCCEVKLVDVPEMNYTGADVPNPRGEICVRGPTLFSGYHKAPELTAEIMDADGWLHTGDVGEWLPGGRLRIIDRKKNIFKLAQGEYIAPEKIEGVYTRSPLVAQAFVYGDSLRAQLVAVIVPDAEELVPWARARGLGTDVTQLCRDRRVVDAVLASMRAEGEAAKLRGFEQVAAAALTPDPFTVENGLLTPTFKLKRPQAQAAFKAAIDDMYARLG